MGNDEKHPEHEEKKIAFHSAVSKKDRMQAGKELRKKCSRKSHAMWKPAEPRKDPVDVLTEFDKNRIPHLVPIRNGRMIKSPFSFYRGSAAIMVGDIAHTPVSGMNLQVCGDCHLMNFGGFASPERKLVFDINDFDETIKGPWEWDVKRLAASFTIAAEWKNFSKEDGKEAAWNVVNSYRLKMQEYAKLSALQVWYAHIELETVVEGGKDEELKKFRQKRLRKALEYAAHEKEFAQLTYMKDGRALIKDYPPLIYHPAVDKEAAFMENARITFRRYMESLPEDRRVLLRRYELQDIAVKVVGVGSVGTLCGIALFMSASADPLFLQFKEAHESVLEPYVKKSPYKNHGERVVMGQKLMQASSDIFLGWTEGGEGRHFYIRQLRDAKIKPILEVMKKDNIYEYARFCGWALARAHARTGDASMLVGYMGKSEIFEDAISQFALKYAEQNEKDYEKMLAAVRTGKMAIE